MPIDYSQQRDFFDPRRWGWPVHLVGLGGIGSAILFPLMKLGVGEIHIWDHDHVEPHNIPSQLIYRPSDVGKQKVDAAMAFAERQEVECTLVAHDEWVTGASEFTGVVISGVDSMRSRRDIWQAVKRNPLVPSYIDSRMGGEYVHQFVLNPFDAQAISRYESTLFTDEQATALPCAARSVIHPPLQIATWVIGNLTLLARSESPKSSLMAGLKGMQYAVG